MCGGRDYAEEWNVFKALTWLYDSHGSLVVLEGGARGADKAARDWAQKNQSRPNLHHERYDAKWREHGKAAGPIRNQRMLDEGKPDLVLAFPGDTGTNDMVARARKANVPVWEWGPEVEASLLKLNHFVHPLPCPTIDSVLAELEAEFRELGHVLGAEAIMTLFKDESLLGQAKAWRDAAERIANKRGSLNGA